MNAPQKIQLPLPSPPVATRVLSRPIYAGDGTDPISWILGRKHPRMPSMTVVRMIYTPAGVEVYAAGVAPETNEEVFMRVSIPAQDLRLVEEAMPLDVFIEELEAADASDDSYEDDDSEEASQEAPPTPISAVSPNGQTNPS